MIVIQRDPRNIAVSTVREDAKHAATERAGGKLPRSERFAALNIAPDVGRADLLRLLRSRHRGARSFVNFVRRFLGWERTGALVVRFETIDTAETVRAIAEFIGVRCDADALAAKARGEAEWAGKKPHYDSTWTGRNSRWQDWWNDEVESAWRAIGGPRLLEEMGYSLPQRSASRSRLRWIVDTI